MKEFLFPQDVYERGINHRHGGITVLDYFAIQILNGMLSDLPGQERKTKTKDLVQAAYRIAEEMIEARGLNVRKESSEAQS